MSLVGAMTLLRLLFIICVGLTAINAATDPPSEAPSILPSVGPSLIPTALIALPTVQPSQLPTVIPTTPTVIPTRCPSVLPTRTPTLTPTIVSTVGPSFIPTAVPTCLPTFVPTVKPSLTPSRIPTAVPTPVPTLTPTAVPTRSPTAVPTRIPTSQPSSGPTSQPSRQPSSQPSSRPSVTPSNQPSTQPSTTPSSHPSRQPSSQPSSMPSSPTSVPSRQPSSVPTGQPSSQPSLQPYSRPSAYPSQQPSMQPSSQPSSVPTRPTGQPSSQPSSRPSRMPSAQPSAQPAGHPSSQPSAQPAMHPSARPSVQPSRQPTRTPSSQPSSKPSRQPSGQPSAQPAGHPSSQPSAQPAMHPSARPSVQPSRQPTRTPSSQPSAKPSRQPSSQPSAQPAGHPSARPSCQPSEQPTLQPSTQPSSQPSLQPFSHPSALPSVQPSSQPSLQPAAHPSAQPSSQPASHPSALPSCQPSSRPSLQPSNQPTSQPSRQPSSQPTRQPSRQPSSQPSGQPTRQPSSQPSRQPTNRPSNQPSSQPTRQPSSQPSVQPSSRPTDQPSSQPTTQPSSQPSALPSSQPSAKPSRQPSSQPTVQPSNRPSVQPSRSPSSQPTVQPSMQPSSQPSEHPSGQPSSRPSSLPTNQPSSRPSSQPTIRPTNQPTGQPSSSPTRQPSRQPSMQPSRLPSTQPSSFPTIQPSSQPSAAPSRLPTTQPTSNPTQPTSQPSGQPSGMPSHQPTNMPSGEPTSLPSAFAECDPGYYYTLRGHTDKHSTVDNTIGYDCIQCPAGQYSNNVRQHCDIADPGYYSKVGASKQTPCATNYYNEHSEQDHCKACPTNYVNGKIGSALKGECFNTSINFIIGSVSVFLAAVVVMIYLFYGRLHKIAFQRKYRLVRKCIMMFGAMLTTADMVNSTGVLLDRIDTGKTVSLGKKIWNKIVLPFFIFPLIVVLVIPIVTAFYVLRTCIQIIFNSMVLFRAYKGYLKDIPNIQRLLNPFLKEVAKLIGPYNIVYYISWPLIKASDVLSGITINLNKVQVTCTGAQSPLYLIVDIIIVFIVIIVIESEVNVFWTMMLSNSMEKLRSLMFNRYYMRGWTRKFTSMFSLTWAALITSIPDPRSLVQYSMGFVVITSFFNFTNPDLHSWVPYSDNCNGAIRLPTGEFFKLDTLLANFSGVVACIMMPTVLYMLSVVLFADEKDKQRTIKDNWNRMLKYSVDDEEKKKKGANPAVSVDEFKVRSTTPQAHVIPTAEVENMPEMVIVEEQHDESSDSGSHFGSESEKLEKYETYDPRFFGRHSDVTPLDKLFDDASQTYSRPTSPDTTDPLSPTQGSKKNVFVLDEKKSGDVGMKHDFYRCLKWWTNRLPLDWVFMGLVFSLGLSVFKRLKNFLCERYMIKAPYIRKNDSPEEIKKETEAYLDCNVRLYVDAFEYHPKLEVLRRYTNEAKLVRLVAGKKSDVNLEFVTERTEEERDWKKLDKALPNYYKMSEEVADALLGEREKPKKLTEEELKTLKEKKQWDKVKEQLVAEKIKKWWVWRTISYTPMAQLATRTGQRHWFRVFKTYYGMLLITLGIWPKWLVNDFQIKEKYREFNDTTHAIYKKVKSETSIFNSEGRLALSNDDTFTKIDNDERISFSQFVYATMACRIALIQIAPIATVFSTLACSLSATPMFVGDEEMNEMLPPMLFWDSLITARRYLRKDYGEEPPLLQGLFLGYFLFINHSRAIQFSISFLIHSLSIFMVFFPTALIGVVPLLIVVVLHQGLLSSGYVILLFKKLLFPPERKAKTEKQKQEEEEKTRRAKEREKQLEGTGCMGCFRKVVIEPPPVVIDDTGKAVQRDPEADRRQEEELEQKALERARAAEEKKEKEKMNNSSMWGSFYMANSSTGNDNKKQKTHAEKIVTGGMGADIAVLPKIGRGKLKGRLDGRYSDDIEMGVRPAGNISPAPTPDPTASATAAAQAGEVPMTENPSFKSIYAFDFKPRPHAGSSGRASPMRPPSTYTMKEDSKAEEEVKIGVEDEEKEVEEMKSAKTPRTPKITVWSRINAKEPVILESRKDEEQGAAPSTGVVIEGESRKRFRI